MLRTAFEEEEGITVPYGPIFDSVCNNYGFVDLRGSPDLALNVPEGLRCSALQELLVDLAQPDSLIFSVGCDLGVHEEPEDEEYRHTAGGYIQILSARYLECTPTDYLEYAYDVADRMKVPARRHSWTLRLIHKPVHFKLDDAGVVPSIWIWFFAGAPTPQRALRSREVLIQSLRHALPHAARKCLEGG